MGWGEMSSRNRPTFTLADELSKNIYLHFAKKKKKKTSKTKRKKKMFLKIYFLEVADK